MTKSPPHCAQVSNEEAATGQKKLWASLVVFAIGALISLATAWYAAQFFGDLLARQLAKRNAQASVYQIRTLLEDDMRSFKHGHVSDQDKAKIRALVSAASMYRIVMFDANGHVFWSTKATKIGSTNTKPYFTDIVAKGEHFGKLEAKKPIEIDNLMSSFAAQDIDWTKPRTVSEDYVPVMSDGKFIGAVGVYNDVTEMYGAYIAYIGIAGAILCGIGLVTFVIAGPLLFLYGRQREAQAKSLITSRDEARATADELRRANERVVKLNADLETSMRELREAQDELVRRGRLAQLGQLTATVAHEVRNPLATVKTAAYLIARKAENSDLGIDKPIERINRGIARCDAIITELLDFTRSKEIEAEPRVFDNWLLDAVSEHAGKLPDAVAVECHLGIGEREVAFDAARLRRVVVNLISNASEAMVGKGEDACEVKTENPRIVVFSRITERGVEVGVSDNGPGMSRDVLDKVLEPLFTTKSFGVGLGLPAVEQIFKQHGGGLDIHSVEGEGTTVAGWFPINLNAQKKEAA